MKHSRRIFAAAVMTCALTLSTFAGDIGVGRASKAGDIGVGKAEAREGFDSQSSSSELILTAMLNTLQNLLPLF